MLPVYMSAYPWDFVDLEAGDLLDRLQGEVGVSGLTIPVALPTLMTLKAQPVSPRVFRTRGGVFFHPSAARYNNTRCKPIASGWIKSRDPFTKIASACCDRRLSLRAVVSATQTGRLPQRHPDLSCKNVFGDVSEQSLCLSNGDVQAYLCDVVADLSATYAIEAILLEDMGCQWAEAWHHDLMASASLGPSARKLLSLCFCESCYQQAATADLDLSQLQDFVMDLLNRVIQQGHVNDADVASAMADSELLGHHSRWLNDSFVAMLTRVRESCQCELGLYVGQDMGPTVTMAKSAGLDLMIANYDGVERSLNELAHCDSSGNRSLENKIRLEIKLNPQAVGLVGADLVNTFQSAVKQNFAGIEVGPLGQCCDDTFSTLKQAIRFARRSLAS